MSTVDLDRIKAEHPLPAYMQRDGIKLVRSSGHFACLCPFHREKSPSCHVWEDHFYCFGCGVKGDIIDYLRLTRSVDFAGALRLMGSFIVAKQIDLTPIYKEADPKAEPRPILFRSMWEKCWHATTEHSVREHGVALGVDPEALHWLGMVWHPSSKAWLFPMYDGAKNMIGLRVRNNDGKKWAIKESRNGIFIPTELLPDRRLFVLEGPTDTAAALTLGFYAIGRASCNSCVDIVLEFLKRNRTVKEVVVCSDNDSPGLKGAEALREKLPLKSWLLLLPTKDIRRFCQSGGGRATVEAMLSSQTPRMPKPTL